MIPRTDAEPIIDVNVEQLRSVDAETVLAGIPCVHGYDPGFYAESSWQRAASCIEHEREALRELDQQATGRRAFDELAFEAEGEDFEPRLELGVWSLAETLGAAGCPTFASCRSHRDGTVPFVAFAADTARLALVEDAARQSGCGLDMDGDGLVRAWGPSLVEVLALATEILRRRSDFDAIPLMVSREDCAVADDDW